MTRCESAGTTFKFPSFTVFFPFVCRNAALRAARPERSGQPTCRRETAKMPQHHAEAASQKAASGGWLQPIHYVDKPPGGGRARGMTPLALARFLAGVLAGRDRRGSQWRFRAGFAPDFPCSGRLLLAGLQYNARKGCTRAQSASRREAAQPRRQPRAGRRKPPT